MAAQLVFDRWPQAVQSLAVHKPTLDDVFLSLTGKPAQTVEAT